MVDAARRPAAGRQHRAWSWRDPTARGARPPTSAGSARQPGLALHRRGACSRWPTAWAATAAARSRPAGRRRRCATHLDRGRSRPTRSCGPCSWPTTPSSRPAADDPELRGMGTTLCAIAVVQAPTRRRAAGHRQRRRLPGLPAPRRRSSSRSPRTTAWSATLVRQGRLTPEEAAVHPQRNILTRALGIDARVDGRLVGGRPGRRRPLPALQRRPVQRGRRRPHRGHAAPAGRPDRGGRASWCAWPTRAAAATTSPCVIVDVVDDDGAPTAPADAADRADRVDRGRVGRGRGRRPRAARLDRPATARRRRRHEPGRAPGRRDAGHAAPPRPRRVTWRVAAVRRRGARASSASASAPSPATGATPTSSASTATRSSIYQGRPGGVLWIEPEVVERTGLTRGDVPGRRASTELDGRQGRAHASTTPTATSPTSTSRSASTGADRPRPPTPSTATAADHRRELTAWARVGATPSSGLLLMVVVIVGAAYVLASLGVRAADPAQHRPVPAHRAGPHAVRPPRRAPPGARRRPDAAAARRRCSTASATCSSPASTEHARRRCRRRGPRSASPPSSPRCSSCRRTRDLERYRYTFALVGIGLLLLPLVPGVGRAINGSRIWVQPRPDQLPARRARQDRPGHLLRVLPGREARAAGHARRSASAR